MIILLDLRNYRFCDYLIAQTIQKKAILNYKKLNRKSRVVSSFKNINKYGMKKCIFCGEKRKYYKYEYIYSHICDEMRNYSRMK